MYARRWILSSFVYTGMSMNIVPKIITVFPAFVFSTRVIFFLHFPHFTDLMPSCDDMSRQLVFPTEIQISKIPFRHFHLNRISFISPGVLTDINISWFEETLEMFYWESSAQRFTRKWENLCFWLLLFFFSFFFLSSELERDLNLTLYSLPVN